MKRNDLCPCLSGKKYKKCCLGTKKALVYNTDIVICGICEKGFNLHLEGSFESIEHGGKRIYFCPQCNYHLSCTNCNRELGEEAFSLFSCNDCGAITVICERCEGKSEWKENHK